jgi:UDP-N-acetylmuramoyl-tripeptide--D-alanyl-D-alanine ligase
VLNALAALAVADTLGVPTDEAVSRVLSVAPAPGRMELKTLGAVTVIDDSYNANPDSMRAALDLLRETTAVRRIAVLGEMLELGRAAGSLHREIGAAAAFADRLLVIGPSAGEMAGAAEKAGLAAERIHVAADFPDLERALMKILEAGDLVLIKGSRGMSLERLLPRVEAWAPAGKQGG